VEFVVDKITDRPSRLNILEWARGQTIEQLNDLGLGVVFASALLEDEFSMVQRAYAAIIQPGCVKPEGLHALRKMLRDLAFHARGELLQDNPASQMKAGWMARVLKLYDDEYQKLWVTASPRPAPRPLLTFEYAKTPPAIEAHLFVRKFYGGHGSRLHDIGYRFATALRNGGWDAVLTDPTYEPFPATRGTRAKGPLAIVDADGLFDADYGRQLIFFERLRHKYERVVAVVFDPWGPWVAERVTEISPLVDCFWSPSPDSLGELFSASSPRISYFPFPVGLSDALRHKGPAPQDRPSRIAFSGSVEPFNFSRLYWVLHLQGYPDLFSIDVSQMVNDGLDVEVSLAAYIARLGRTIACLSLTKRSSGAHIITGRTFDVLSLGRLLVQERCEDMLSYFDREQHFCEFETVDDLLTIAEEVRSNSRRMQEIAESGARFFEERYSDRAAVQHLTTLL
jgi:hypothetical protein